MDNEDLKAQLEKSAKWVCGCFGIQEETIKIEYAGTHTDIQLGSIELDGFVLSIDIFNIDNSLGRIIVFCGKNRKNQSVYAETREQEMLTHFLNQDHSFIEWINQSMERLEKRFG